MRFLSGLLFLVAPFAVAQTTPPDASYSEPTGAFYSEIGVSGGFGSSLGVIAGGSGSLGYRLPSGISVGGHVSGFQFGASHTGLAIGPELRYDRALDERTVLDVYASGTLGLYSGGALESSGLRATGIGTQVGATATRRFELGGGVKLATIGGVLGGVSRSFDQTTSAGFEYQGRVGAYAGVTVGAQVEFNALGGRFAIGPVLQLPIVSTGFRPSLGVDSHGTNAYHTGGGPRRGFLTFTF